MKKIVNNTHLEGYLWGHTLEKKIASEQAKNAGVEFIAGTLEIITDDESLNVVPVNFRFVTAKTKAGKVNATFTTLEKIIASENKTYQDCGTAAMKLKVDTALGLNDFYTAEDELITYKLNDGGFVHIINSFSDTRNYFEVDTLIMNTVVKEEDEEKGTPEMLIIKGATFNFMESILPIELTVKDPGGIKFFDNLGATPSEPVFLKVWGHVLCSTVESQTVEESTFGEASVKISSRKLREWVVTGASTESYNFGDEAILTTEEVAKAVADRETYLAGVKNRHDEYMASKNPNAGVTAENAVTKGFKF